MDKEEIVQKVNEVIDYLNNCKEYVQEDNSFEAEYWIGATISKAKKAKELISSWADEQEKKIGEEEEKKGYEVLK